MVTCATVEVIEKSSNKRIVINEVDFDSSLYKYASRTHEDAPRATIASTDDSNVKKKTLSRSKTVKKQKTKK